MEPSLDEPRTPAEVGDLEVRTPGSARRTVAIWGSCVTRDCFAVASRQEQVAAALPLVYYGARSSWISQASRVWPRPDLSGDGLSGFPLRMVTEELRRAIPGRLAAHQPDLVVIDLCDERLQLARYSGRWVTLSEYVQRTAVGKALEGARTPRSLMTSPGRLDLFTDAVDRLVPWLTRALPRTTFVLNEAPYTTAVAGGSTLPEPQAGWARELDEAQRPMFDALERAFAGRLVRLRPPAAVADPDHRWGLASYHYVEDYYHWLLDELLALPAPTGGGALARRLGKAGGRVRLAGQGLSQAIPSKSVSRFMLAR